MSIAVLCRGTCFLVALLSGAAAGQSTTRVSLSTGGTQGSLASDWPVSSGDGRFVAFQSLAANLVASDTNACTDVFLHDRLLGTTIRVSVDSAGNQADAESLVPAISTDGRFVAYISMATNLVAGDTNGCADIFVHDWQSGTTERVSVDSAGAEGNAESWDPALSADGRFVCFSSFASNMVTGDTNGLYDIFVHDRTSGATERASVDSAGAEANQQCTHGTISLDGRFVAFQSAASNLVASDTNGIDDVFVHDRASGATERASVSSAGVQGNGWSRDSSLSADGSLVAFMSYATNLVAGDTNGSYDIFLRNRQLGTTELISVSTSGVHGNGASQTPSISSDGSRVGFHSFSTNLVAGDTNAFVDAFIRDRLAGTTLRVSVSTSGTQGNNDSGIWRVRLSADGSTAVFPSHATNLVTGDTNGVLDVFAHYTPPPSPGIDLCQPGTAGVLGCPCANPPASAPRGCDNSSATGGAQLTSSGAASLASDTVMFVTNGERPTATSVVLQGNAEILTGVAFGQGVRCAGGGLKRLYVKSASGGSITAPEAGDPSVSARSAALGDSIGAGTSRWYAVYYRDPLVLGGCPATSTYNITQTQLVTWGS